MFTSNCIQNNSNITFPEFTGERVYMQKFFKKTGLPQYLSRWQNTVDQMLENVDSDDAIYIMIDQGVVTPSKTHRRAGKHIDGYWHEEIRAHGGGRHLSAGRWNSGGRWSNAKLSEPEAIILASDVTACYGYTGKWDGTIKDGGDLSAANLGNLRQITLQQGNSYIGNVGFVHESVCIDREAQRSLVRLNVKNWEPSW